MFEMNMQLRVRECEVCRNFFKTKNPKMRACSECYDYQNINNYLENLLERVSHGYERILGEFTFGDQDKSK